MTIVTERDVHGLHVFRSTIQIVTTILSATTTTEPRYVFTTTFYIPNSTITSTTFTTKNTTHYIYFSHSLITASRTSRHVLAQRNLVADPRSRGAVLLAFPQVFVIPAGAFTGLMVFTTSGAGMRKSAAWVSACLRRVAGRPVTDSAFFVGITNRRLGLRFARHPTGAQCIGQYTGYISLSVLRVRGFRSVVGVLNVICTSF
jgi:hypothetical protein